MKENISPEQLKEVMRSWITGVAIVTGYLEGTIHGMTANSFNSIALSPPTVLIALQHYSRTQQLVKEGKIFAVSILDNKQQALAMKFAGQSEDGHHRFEGVETFTMVTGAPLIKDAMAYLDCVVINAFDVGQTTVFLGEVVKAQKNDLFHEPLLYFNRGWRKLEK
jgi:flavin reductase (DIM6/NTAB) family NADH-FMN oxidoreductase RutF